MVRGYLHSYGLLTMGHFPGSRGGGGMGPPPLDPLPKPRGDDDALCPLSPLYLHGAVGSDHGAFFISKKHLQQRGRRKW